jgi:DNA-binding GntR family transcriptional regulator
MLATPMAVLALEALNLRAAHEDLTEKTYRALKDLIVSRTLPAGSKVTAEGLSQHFGVSRTTVKGALDQLASEGLVDVRPHVGTFVRGLTAADVREIWEVRAIIESSAVKCGVLRATDAQRESLREIVEQMAPTVEGSDYREDTYPDSVRLNRRLHELLVETAANAHLLSMYRQLDAYVHIANFRSRRGIRRADVGLEEHRAIAAAYEQRDPERAAAIVTGHLERSRDVLLKALPQLGDLL